MDTNPQISKSFTIGIILLFVGMSIIPSTAQNTEKPSLLFSGGGDHLPIHINDNRGFTLENGVTRGDGTITNPYLIENWVFITNGSDYAISIRNTNAYFIVATENTVRSETK